MLAAVRVALFVPCYVDQLRPGVGRATVSLLERLGVAPEFPEAQTCCGQALLNAGGAREARRLAERLEDVFRGYEHVVCPSGSCTAMVRRQVPRLLGRPASDFAHVRELCEFLGDVLGVRRIAGRFPHRVALHPSCHGLRELRLGAASERPSAAPDRVASLLSSLEGIELVTPARADECCGFGGTFAVDEAAVSTRMGRDRLDAQQAAGASVVTSVDVSCLLHLEGLARREGRPVRLLHVAELLAEAAA